MKNKESSKNDVISKNELSGNNVYRMNRRTFVKVAGATAGAVAFGAGLSSLIKPVLASSPQTTPFQVPLPIPEVLTPNPSVTITMKTAQLQILPAPYPKTTVWAYYSPADLVRGNKAGSYLGPIIKATSGKTIQVTQVNNLTVPTTVHLHGGHTPAVDDGSPVGSTAIIQPGASRVYTYPNNQIAANLWYHDHTMDVTGRNVYMGLAGFYMLQDDFELSLNLPSGNYDIPLVIQDRQFNADGSLYYPQPLTSQVIKEGFLGDTILVNGAIQPYFQVANRKYRFRLLNGSNARHYTLTLSPSSSKYGSGVNFTQIGTDGGLLPAPVTLSSIALAPAERVEIVIDFSKFAIGTQLTLKNSDGYGSTGDIMRFDIVRQESDPSSLPATLRPFTAIDPSTAKVTRNIDLDFDRSANKWVLNGLPFDPNRVDFKPKLGDIEIWQFNNHSGMLHPMHIHDIMFQVLSGGSRYSYGGGTTVSGWKDTVAVDSWGSAKVIMQFSDNLGKYVFHCHKLEHEDQAMMGQFEVVQ